MENNYEKDLLDKYNKGLCTEEEKALVETWFQEREVEGYIPSKEQIERVGREVWDKMYEIETPMIQPKTINWPFRILSVAAIFITILSIGTYLFVPIPLPVGFKNDINPGTNQATLTLSDGSIISLTAATNGTVINQSDVKITKTDDGTVTYESTIDDRGQESARLQNGEKEELNTISTPRGGQYQIILPDGSHVWLNAASKLIYPVSFNGRNDRKVKLSGEAYFEIAKNKKQPFIVISEKQQVQVLGTHFNISSYPDEPNTKTTLVEGSVRVTASPPSFKEGWSKTGVVLKPNQQSINSGTIIKINTIYVEDAIAWKNGEFSFREEPLESIMQKISRWYNVEIIYENEQARKKIFGGSISKFEKVSEVLCMLELTGDVKFKVEGRRITVE